MNYGEAPQPAGSGGGHDALLPALSAIRRRLWLVVLVAVAVPAAAYVVSTRQQELYTATASVVLSDLDPNVKPQDRLVVPDPVRKAVTSVALGLTGTVAERAAERLGGGVTAGEVQGSIAMATAEFSDLVTITATNADPTLATRIANATSREFVAYRRRVSNVQTGGARVVETASAPAAPSSPKTGFNTILGLGLGLPLGLALALVVDRVDRRLRTTRELETILGAPVLGRIPQRNAAASADRAGSAEIEAFELLRANLRYATRQGSADAVLVTAAAAGGGSSTVALNLARAAAAAGERTLLIEADMRDPGLAEILGRPEAGGLSEYLAGEQDLDGVIESLGADGRDGDRDGLDLVLAGAVAASPVRLIESDRMRELLERAHDDYDLVLVDAPPLTQAAETIALSSRLEAVIVVVRLGRDRRETLEATADQFLQLGTRPLGSVANSAGREAGPVRSGTGSRARR